MGCIIQPDIQEGYICINCGEFLPTLYEKYGEFHIRLSPCQHCNSIADKYIEYDNVLLFIDLILLKPTAYRHTIYNVFLAPNKEPFAQALKRTQSQTVKPLTNEASRSQHNQLTPLVFRLGILMMLFEVYITWAYQEKGYLENKEHTSLIIKLVLGSPLQYAYFLSTTILQNALLCVFLTYWGLIWLPFGCNTLYQDYQHSNLRSSSPETVFQSQSTPTCYTQAQILRNQSYRGYNSLQTPTRHQVFDRAVPSSQRLDNYSDHIKINHNQSKPSFVRVLNVMTATVLISNIIKLFPIVMLIWPYDSPILSATRIMVRIVHLLLLVEAIHIVFIDPKNHKTRHTLLLSSQATLSAMYASANVAQSSSNDYYCIIMVVLASEFFRFLISHVTIAFLASAVWGVSVREIGLDDWRMIKVGFSMVEDLGEYLLSQL